MTTEINDGGQAFPVEKLEDDAPICAIADENADLRAEVKRLRDLVQSCHAVMRECCWQLAIAEDPQIDGAIEVALHEVAAMAAMEVGAQ